MRASFLLVLTPFTCMLLGFNADILAHDTPSFIEQGISALGGLVSLVLLMALHRQFQSLPEQDISRHILMVPAGFSIANVALGFMWGSTLAYTAGTMIYDVYPAMVGSFLLSSLFAITAYFILNSPFTARKSHV